MGTLWFWIVVLMLTAYVILDGFDLGVCNIYPFVARTEPETRQALRSIGPVWDGNRSLSTRRGRHAFLRLPAVLRLGI